MARSDRYTRKILTSGDRSKWSDLYISDSNKIILGAGNDLQIYHDGTDNHIEATSALNIATANSGVAVKIGHSTSEVSVSDNFTVTGDVGIGTASPSQKLTVEGNIELGTGGYIYGDTTTPYLRLNNSAGTVLGYSNGYISLGPSFVYNNASGEQFRISHSNGNVGIGTTSPQELMHLESTEPIIRFDDTNSGLHYLVGQVGDAFVFDTNNPTYGSYSFDANLSVVGTGSFTGQVTIPATPVATTDAASKSYVDGQVGASDTLEEVTANGNSTSYGISFTSTNFSIGSAKIGLYSNNLVYLRGGSAGLLLQNGDGVAAHQLTQSGNHIFEANGEKMRLTTGGNLGIGTTSPAGASGKTLEIYGGSGQARLAIKNDDTGGGSGDGFQISLGSGVGGRVTLEQRENSDMAFSTNAAEKMRLTSAGNLLLGTTTDSGAYRLDVSGKARVQSVLELDDVLTLNAISTPSDPASGKSSIYMDSADGAIKVKINVGGTVVTRTIASYE